jgi:hypothetical protein
VKDLEGAVVVGGVRTHVDIPGGRFAGLGLKTRGASGAAGRRWWRIRGVKICIEAKRSREDGIWHIHLVLQRNLDDFTPKGYLGCMLSGGCFGHYLGRLYI